MTEIRNSKQYDLEERSGSCRIARNVALFVKKLPKSTANIEYGKQVIRSSGSTGANYTCPVRYNLGRVSMLIKLLSIDINLLFKKRSYYLTG